MTILIFILAVAVYAAGSLLDIRSSIGKREAIWFSRGRDGYFSLKKAMIVTVSFAVFCLLWAFYSQTGALLGLFGVGILRALVSIRNSRIPRSR